MTTTSRKPSGPDTSPADPSAGTGTIWLAPGAVLVAAFMDWLDVSIVAAAAPSIAADLHTTLGFDNRRMIKRACAKTKDAHLRYTPTPHLSLPVNHVKIGPFT